MWSANVDDMITYPAYFEKDILPWCRKAADRLRPKGIFLVMHPDGENRGLMDLIPRCGMDIADAVTPYPMTKIKIGEYYDKWSRNGGLTIHGGIPEMLLLEESTSLDDLKAYMDELFQVIIPGTRFVASIGDTCPPNTDFDRLLYIGERIAKEGLLPLRAGGADSVTEKRLEEAKTRVTPVTTRKETPSAVTTEKAAAEDDWYAVAREDVLKGDYKKLVLDAQQMLDEGYRAQDILNIGMLPAMEVIGEKFTDGSVFIPEVLLSARAVNEALKVLEPHLKGAAKTSGGKIMIGTVRGDLHDIGKNMVITMLKGVGFDTIDLGVNVKVEDFVKRVYDEKPDILGMSALLTTTMPQVKDVIDALAEAGLRDKVTIMVGGAPVNQKFADDVGADGYAHDAGEAVTLVKRLIAAKQ
jgi:corrinoid protein of di/trimethylamine methyltransferase